MRILTAFKKHMESHPKERKVAGGVLLALGITALVTPFTPGAWLALIGMELLGVRHFMELYAKKPRKSE